MINHVQALNYNGIFLMTSNCQETRSTHQDKTQHYYN